MRRHDFVMDAGDFPTRWPRGCVCGTDLPGNCPGRQNCPYSGDMDTHCRVCRERTTHRQDADDTWICEACEQDEVAE